MVSRFVFFLFIFPVFLMATLATDTMAEGLSWTQRTGTCIGGDANLSSDEELHIIVTASKTEISSRSEILFIDYKLMALYRFDRLLKQCSTFDLRETEANGMVKQTVSQFAEFSVKASGEKREIKGFQCTKKTVLSGAGLFRMKTFVPKVLVRYGQSFREAVGEYFVAQEFEHWQILREFVTQRQVAFTAQPLLRRIDPVGLIEAVDGFPVQGWQKSSEGKVDYVLVRGPETGSFIMQPPQVCKSVLRQGNDALFHLSHDKVNFKP